jgi:putative transposase
MKAYSLDLRQRVVAYVENGGKKTEAARRFGVGRDTVYRFLNAAKSKTLAPKTSWGHWRKLDPKRLGAYMRAHPDATLEQARDVFNVSRTGVWRALKRMKFTLKKSHRVL